MNGLDVPVDGGALRMRMNTSAISDIRMHWHSACAFNWILVAANRWDKRVQECPQMRFDELDFDRDAVTKTRKLRDGPEI